MKFNNKESVDGVIRNNLKNKGTPIGANAMLIAASALSRGLVVLTHNTSEFERVENLMVFDPCEDFENNQLE